MTEERALIPEDLRTQFEESKLDTTILVGSDIRVLIMRIAALETQLSNWLTWGVIEIAVRNPNVSSYMDHWEKRATDAESRAEQLGEQLEHDRSLVADCVTAATKAVRSRDWLTEGRGCYEWNDDRWHSEFVAAADEFLAAIEPMRKVAADWTGCPQTSAEVADARIDLKAHAEQLAQTVAALTRERDGLRLPLENCRNGLSLLLQEHEPNRPNDPWDTINELRQTVKTATAALAAETKEKGE